jgi:hypothetical protein
MDQRRKSLQRTNQINTASLGSAGLASFLGPIGLPISAGMAAYSAPKGEKLKDATTNTLGTMGGLVAGSVLGGITGSGAVLALSKILKTDPSTLQSALRLGGKAGGMAGGLGGGYYGSKSLMNAFRNDRNDG